MNIGKVPSPRSSGQHFRQISPTDIAQFIRLEQCQRYLRLRLYQRNVSSHFMEEYGVKPQSIPPILTRSGATFEEKVERAVAQRYWKIHFVDDLAHGGRRAEDNERVMQLARELARGEVVVLFQPRLQVALDGWQVRGDIDMLRMERDGEGVLHLLIADMKSSTSAKVEHRLQVAFYHKMLAQLFAQEAIAHGEIDMGVLYRGPIDGGGDLSADEAAERVAQQEAAERFFGTREGLLEIVPHPQSYTGAVRDLVTGPDSVAARVAEADFGDVPYHLTYKCDGCMFNEFCMKWSAEHDDLSLLPHLSSEDKTVLRRAGITTTRELATLKQFRPDGSGRVSYHSELVPAPGKEALVRRLAASWPVGPRLDELVHRARRYRKFKKDDIEALAHIPSKGYGSLPYTDARHNPNLVRIYVDAQHDYLHDRIYMLGALVAGCENGVEQPQRRRSIVHLAEGPPETSEREEQLFVRWVRETMRAVVEVAAPDEHGQPLAPIHVIFFNHFDQRLLLDGLARHFSSILEATPLYDFVTQLAAFDSPIATFLDLEIRELKNYPMVCQSLQTVAAYLQFDWNVGTPYREIFRTRMFDFWGKLDWDPKAPKQESPWYTSRARFNSQIPLEYAYAAWGELEEAPAGNHDDFASYRGSTPELLTGFQARRLQAMEWITHDFPGNRQTEKRPFHLPDLSSFDGKAQTLAQALDEFVTIERHVELAAWKTAHLAPPERRVLAGETLLVRHREADQEPEVAARNRENVRRNQLVEAWRADNPGARMTKQERQEMGWSQEGMRFRLHVECAGTDCELDEVLALSSFRPGERLVLYPRTTVDSRLPSVDQKPFTPTPKQMLYGPRVDLLEMRVERDAAGRAVSAFVEVEMQASRGGPAMRGFAFGSIDRPLLDGELYTLDADPNNFYGYFCAKVTEELCALEASGATTVNALYDRLTSRQQLSGSWPDGAGGAQERFLQGLDALRKAGELHDFEQSKRDYISRCGDAPTLLVQGPPGTGKSYSTAFALFARLQGAMAAGLDFRVLVCCKTHAATDVLLENIVRVRLLLGRMRDRHPDIFGAYFDARLLDLPLFRVHARAPQGAMALHRKEDRESGEPPAVDAIMAHRWCIAASTPGGVYRMIKDKWPNSLFGHTFCHCLVLDEASQMNLPEAIMAALPLEADGRLIVVGDHRQMPPIVKHDWSNEPRRTFREFHSYESLFLALLERKPPMIQFSESFRLHADMAEFLRKEIYYQDGIRYFSNKQETLAAHPHHDPFVASVLRPEHTIVVVVHDEAQSLLRNPFEQALITPVLEALAGRPYRLNPEEGLGVVVPHRAQRAALQEAIPALSRTDSQTGAVTISAVDTVERFQGGERSAILVSATESDREYLLVSSEFLLDPRRLTVALSRAKHKMVLVASRSVFNLFSADEETFANSQLWKNLLRSTCTVKLWEGEREGTRVQVWGNE